MFRWFLRRQIAGFERTWNYDASYLHELIKVDPQAMLAFGKLQGSAIIARTCRGRMFVSTSGITMQ